MSFERAETASESHRSGAAGEPPKARRTRFPGAAADRLSVFLRRHGLTLAAAVAVLGGLLLLYAETLDLYRIVTPSGSISNAAGSVRTGSDQHSWAFGVIGIAGAGAAVLARATRQRLPALAAAMLGVIAVIAALAVDLPDVTASGVTTELEVGDADPAAGFWIELVGALVMVGGAAWLASLLRGARSVRPSRARARR